MILWNYSSHHKLLSILHCSVLVALMLLFRRYNGNACYSLRGFLVGSRSRAATTPLAASPFYPPPPPLSERACSQATHVITLCSMCEMLFCLSLQLLGSLAAFVYQHSITPLALPIRLNMPSHGKYTLISSTLIFSLPVSIPLLYLQIEEYDARWRGDSRWWINLGCC